MVSNRYHLSAGSAIPTSGQPDTVTVVSDRIRLAIVDDDPLVRAGLSMILGGAPDIEVVAEGCDGDEALGLVREHRPAVLLMDIRMPRLDGIEAAARVLAEPEPPQVIMLTTFDADDMVVRALRSGASGFLLKDTPPARLVESIRSVAAGEPILSPTVTATLISRVAAEPGTAASNKDSTDRKAMALKRLADLTEREREVAVAVGQGLSNQEIADELYMGVPTVKAHVSRILTKLGAENRVQIAIVVHDAGEL